MEKQLSEKYLKEGHTLKKSMQKVLKKSSCKNLANGCKSKKIKKHVRKNPEKAKKQIKQMIDTIHKIV